MFYNRVYFLKIPCTLNAALSQKAMHFTYELFVLPEKKQQVIISKKLEFIQPVFIHGCMNYRYLFPVLAFNDAFLPVQLCSFLF
jgi:hypothetical protein